MVLAQPEGLFRQVRASYHSGLERREVAAEISVAQLTYQ
jgi:hypothetical protein